jgi:hypothetical protein
VFVKPTEFGLFDSAKDTLKTRFFLLEFDSVSRRPFPPQTHIDNVVAMVSRSLRIAVGRVQECATVLQAVIRVTFAVTHAPDSLATFRKMWLTEPIGSVTFDPM